MLREALARRTGVSTEEIFVGLGSSEIIDLASRVLLRVGLQGMTSHGTYAPFSVAIRASGTRESAMSTTVPCNPAVGFCGRTRPGHRRKRTIEYLRCMSIAFRLSAGILRLDHGQNGFQFGSKLWARAPGARCLRHRATLNHANAPNPLCGSVAPKGRTATSHF